MTARVSYGVAAAWAAACLCGCTAYRFDLVQPTGVAGVVPPGSVRLFVLDPLRYGVGTADGRLSIEVYNPTDQTVRLLGSQSTVVDPAGHSHPLIGQTIAARSDVRVVLPPLRPYGGSAYEPGRPAAELGVPTDDGLTYDRASPVYWDWPGVGVVRVHLVYDRPDGGGPFQHDLAFDRQVAR